MSRYAKYLLLTTSLSFVVGCLPENPRTEEVGDKPNVGVEEKEDAARTTAENAPFPSKPIPPSGLPPVIETEPDYVLPPREISSPLLNRGGSGGNADLCPTDSTKLRPGVCGCGVPDSDNDGDGVINCVDNCPASSNPTQDDTDSDGRGDACDNCILVSNPEQDDEDEDGIGTACDCDDNINLLGEIRGTPRFVDVNIGIDQGDCTDFKTPCRTIAYGIFRANDGDTVVAAKGVYHESNLNIDKTLFIYGAGPANTIVRGNGSARVFSITDPLDQSDFSALCGLTITGGSADIGGGVLNHSQLAISNCAITDNHADVSGGGFYNDGNTEVLNASISNNTSGGDGGGFTHQNQNMFQGFALMAFSNVDGNHAAGDGGGFYVSNAFIQILFLTTVNNNSASNGAGIFVTNQAVIANALYMTISNNTASQYGGGIFLNSSQFFVLNLATVSNNTAATGNGGGLYGQKGSQMGVEKVTFSGNAAPNASGGGLSLHTTVVLMQNSTISGNVASLGGGVDIDTNSVLSEALVTNTNNTATVSGGGVQNAGILSSTHSIIADQASGANCSGGGVFFSSDFNLESAATCNFNQANDLQNASAELGPLQFNGGFSQTHALLVNSEAIDAGNTTCSSSVDQRDDPRPINIVGIDPIDAQARCDIGAFEVQQ